MPSFTFPSKSISYDWIWRKAILWIVVPLGFIGLLLVGLVWGVKWNFERQRTDWKDQTLPRLAALSINDREISDEMQRLKDGASDIKNKKWAGESVLLMKNGEYLIYGFRHGFNNGAVDHLFLARGSDGKWLYSTYHFCNHMNMVAADTPPESIADFAKRYYAVEFDGQSNVCLRTTWHPQDSEKVSE